MAKQTINAADALESTSRTKINDNFTELYDDVADLVAADVALDTRVDVLEAKKLTTYTVEPSTDDTAEGDCLAGILAGDTIAQWDLVYLDTTSGRWEFADADAVATAGSVLIGLAMAAATDGNALTVFLSGIVRNDGWNWTKGNALYPSTTPGAMTATAASGTDDVVRVMGYALSDDCVLFDPGKGWITRT